jgi:hypothetical protein
MTRRRVISVLTLLVVAVLGLVAAALYDRHKARVAFADMSQCMLGAEGATSANVAVRYRRHQIAPLDSAAPDWPRTCERYAKRARDLTASPFWARSDEMRDAFEAVGRMLSLGTDADTDSLVPAWAIAEQEGLIGLASSVEGPPAHPDIPTVDDLESSVVVAARTGDLLALSSEPLFGAASPGLVSANHYCWLTDDALRCVAHPFDDRQQVPLIGMHHSVAVGRGPLYRTKTDVFLASSPDRPFARADLFEGPGASSWAGPGDLTVIATGHRGTPALSVHVGGRLQSLDFEAELARLFHGDPPLRSEVLGPVRASFGYLYFLGERGGGIKLYSVRVRDDGVLVDPTELAAVTTPSAGWRVEIRSCQPDGNQPIVLVSIDDETYIVFGGPDDAKVVAAGEKGGVYRLLGCAQGRVVLDGSDPIECTRGGCAARKALDQEPRRTPFRSAEAPLDDHNLHVWVSEHGWHNGVRLELARPLRGRLNVPNRRILDDAVSGGQVHTTGLVNQLQLFGGDRAALLIVLLDDGRELALRIDATGSARPAPVEWVEP